ncbi:hypothetical protein V1478_011935 [Vespula squamosa]|uniref:Uncharacterized protein n=1 Tax=Vespula squamosa TaxID=30214 RepID=A0ABD2ABS8_VESSQ
MTRFLENEKSERIEHVSFRGKESLLYLYWINPSMDKRPSKKRVIRHRASTSDWLFTEQSPFAPSVADHSRWRTDFIICTFVAGTVTTGFAVAAGAIGRNVSVKVKEDFRESRRDERRISGALKVRRIPTPLPLPVPQPLPPPPPPSPSSQSPPTNPSHPRVAIEPSTRIFERSFLLMRLLCDSVSFSNGSTRRVRQG